MSEVKLSKRKMGAPLVISAALLKLWRGKACSQAEDDWCANVKLSKTTVHHSHGLQQQVQSPLLFLCLAELGVRHGQQQHLGIEQHVFTSRCNACLCVRIHVAAQQGVDCPAQLQRLQAGPQLLQAGTGIRVLPWADAQQGTAQQSIH